MYPNKIRYDIAMLVPKDAKSVLEIGAGSGKNCVIYPKDSYKVATVPTARRRIISRAVLTNTTMCFTKTIKKTASST